MRLETFFEKFDLFSDAPNAVAKMRDLVLHLGISGRLSARTKSWQAATLGEVVRLRRGYDLPTQDRNQGVFPIFAANGPVGVHDTYMVKGPGVVTGRSGSIGRVHFVEGDFWPLNTALYVEDFFGNYPQFICLLLRSLHLERFSTATAVPTLNRNVVHKELVRVPPLAEQKKIVAKVDELMALCDRLEAQQQERETRHAALARASLARFAEAPTPANLEFIFHKSYDIAPADLRKTILTLAVEGKLVPQVPEDGDAHEQIDRAMKNRQQTIQSKGLRRKSLDESANLFSSEELPNLWCIERLANLVDPENTISYGVLVPGNDVADGVPFVRAQDLSLSNHPARPNKTIAPEVEKPYARTRLTGGEILLCVVGSIGKLGVVPESWAGANIARAVARIKPIPDVDRDYLLIVLQETAVQTFFTSSTRTLAQPTLNVGLIEQTPIPVPPLAEQKRIVAKVDQLMALVDELEAQLAASRATGEKLLAALVAELTAVKGNGTPINMKLTRA